jgi:hypothetical protein
MMSSFMFMLDLETLLLLHFNVLDWELDEYAYYYNLHLYHRNASYMYDYYGIGLLASAVFAIFVTGKRVSGLAGMIRLGA